MDVPDGEGLSPVMPSSVKDRERDDERHKRLNTLWFRLDDPDLPVELLLHKDITWLYTRTREGIHVGAEDVAKAIGTEQFDALLTGMRTRDPGLTAEGLRSGLDGLGHPTIAVQFTGERVFLARGDGSSDRLRQGELRELSPVLESGEFRHYPQTGHVVNDKSGRFMGDKAGRYPGEVPRGQVDQALVHRGLGEIAQAFSDRLGVAVTPYPEKRVNAPVALAARLPLTTGPVVSGQRPTAAAAAPWAAAQRARGAAPGR